jgi:hypothetical protein
VSGRYSNHADQEKRIREVLQCDVFGVPKTKTRTLRRPQRRLSTDELDALFESYERGASVNVLAEEFSIHRSTVLDHLNSSTARRRYPGLDDREVNMPNSSTALDNRSVMLEQASKSMQAPYAQLS